MMSPRPPSLVKPLSVSPALSRMLGSCASPRTPVEMPRANGDLGGCAIPGSAGLFEGCCSPGVLGCDTMTLGTADIFLTTTHEELVGDFSAARFAPASEGLHWIRTSPRRRDARAPVGTTCLTELREKNFLNMLEDWSPGVAARVSQETARHVFFSPAAAALAATKLGFVLPKPDASVPLLVSQKISS